MKKITLLLLLMTFSWSSFSQIAIVEGFNTSNSVPPGWTSTGFFGGTTTAPCEGLRIIRKNFYNTSATGNLISPTYTAASNGTNVTVTFQWKSNEWSAGAGVGFTVNAQFTTDGTTWQNIGSPIVATSIVGCTNFSATIPAASVPNASNFQFRVDGVWNSGDCYFEFDNLSVTQVASAQPVCPTGLTATANASCGNFDVPLTWTGSAGALGYRINLGTTSGGTNILNNVDLGSVTSYNFSNPTSNTTYYWKIIPYNGVGPSTGCIESTFATAVNPCFCTPAPSSVDGIGITNVIIGTINNTTVAEAGNYGDYSAQITNVGQGLTTPFSITYQTAYTYDTKIWVDWNNDFDFDDAGEESYSGVSTNANPTTLSGSILIPSGASLGNHRMRVGGIDSGTLIPCYSGPYGSFEDYTINVNAANCTPPAATASLSSCGSGQYSIAVNVTGLGNGTPTISDGTNSIPVTAIGSYTVGPIAFGTPVTITLLHGSNAICNVPLGTFNYAVCPPTNDDCANATSITAAGDFSTAITASTIGASGSSNPAPITCTGYSGGDIWFTTTIPTSGSLTIETGLDATAFDSVITIYSGTSCGALTQIDCDDDAIAPYSRVILSGRTPGETIYIRAYEYSNDLSNSFKIGAYDASLGASTFDLIGFSAYPNPVKDILNLTYTQNISKVSIHNLLGQEVITKSINATQSQIDMSSLTNGTYLVKVTVDGLVKTLKVLKQ